MDDETRRVGEIEADIAVTRVELSETIGAIQERLTPSNIVANAKETMRHAATEKVRQMTDNSFMDTVRANPVPSAMIGLGAAWLLLKARSGSDKGYRASREWRNPRGYSDDAYPESDDRRDYAVGTRGVAAYEGASGAAAGYRESVGNMGRELSSRTREMAGDLGDTARETTRRAQLKFNDVLRDNPLMLGAAAALIGAAVGMSVPATETENQLMGEARDAVVDRAQNLASDAASQVSEVVGNVQQEAGSIGQAADTVAGTSSFADSTSSSESVESTGPGSPSRRRGRTPTQS
jgi:ElaB/YqjD/DUF883 family membrane-anchored ribosome-binding protein